MAINPTQFIFFLLITLAVAAAGAYGSLSMAYLREKTQLHPENVIVIPRGKGNRNGRAGGSWGLLSGEVGACFGPCIIKEGEEMYCEDEICICDPVSKHCLPPPPGLCHEECYKIGYELTCDDNDTCPCDPLSQTCEPEYDDK